MARGGWRGGVKPRAWLLRSGEPAKLTRIEFPVEFKDDLREIAHMLDRGEITIEQIRSLRSILETRSIEEFLED